MSIIESVKRAPRWAWVTAAGIGIGAGAIKLYRDRDAEAAELTAETVSGAPGAIGTAAPASAGAPGVVIPPVIIGGNESDPNVGVPVLQDLYVGALQDIFSGFGGLVAMMSGQQHELLMSSWGSLQSIAEAGGAPGRADQNPSPVVVHVPAGQPAPVPLPAPPRPGPAPAPPQKPCCVYNGHPLSWWQNASHNRRNGRWRWPDGSGQFKHTRKFAGHKACDGGGTADGSKREC